MKSLILLVFAAIILPSIAGEPVVLPKNNAGDAVELSHMPLTPMPAEQRSSPDEDDDKVLSVRLLAPDPAKHSKPLILPLRVDLAKMDPSSVSWSADGTRIAIVLECWKPKERPTSCLLVFSCRDGDIRPLPLPDVGMQLVAMRRDLAILSLEYVTTIVTQEESPTPKVFGWIGEDLLAVRIDGSCELGHDIGGAENREVHGSVVFHVTKDGIVTIREVLGLRIQG